MGLALHECFLAELRRARSVPGDLGNLERQLRLGLTLQNWSSQSRGLHRESSGERDTIQERLIRTTSIFVPLKSVV